MSARSFLLTVSLAANGVLLAMAFGWPERAADPALVEPLSTSRLHELAAEQRPAPTLQQPLQVADPLWAHLDDPDPLVLMRRLLAAGFPRTVVPAVVRDRIEARGRKAMDTVLGDELELPYWRLRDARYDRQTKAVLHRMLDEDLRLTKEVTLEFLADDDTAGDSLWREYGVRDPKKQRQLLELSYDYMEVALTTQADNEGMGNRDTLRQAQQLIEKERRAEIAELLTPEEFAEFDLRQGRITDHLRSRLSRFESTEQEYRALHAACSSRVASAGNDTGIASITDEELAEIAASVLPPDRYAELRQVTTPNTLRINRLVKRFGLPLATAAPVIEVRREIEQRATAIREDSTLPSIERASRLAALATEAHSRISAVFPPELLAAYVECDSDWLVDLAAAGTLKDGP